MLAPTRQLFQSPVTIGVRNIGQLFEEGSAIDQAVRRAGLAARREYARAGLSMPVWCNGRVVWVEPEDLEGDSEVPQADRGAGIVCRPP
jgi:hypothetical protein